MKTKHKPKLILIAALSLLTSLNLSVASASTYPDITIPASSVVSIYDGDSFRIDIPDYPKLIGQNVLVRVLGIDTPEMRGSVKQRKRWQERQSRRQ